MMRRGGWVSMIVSLCSLKYIMFKLLPGIQNPESVDGLSFFC